MDRLTDWFRRPGNRGWLYRVLTAAGLVAAGYGLVAEHELGLWLGLAATILGTGTAAVNTPTTAQARAARGREDYALELELEAGDHENGRVRRRKFERRPR